jgi:membrane protein
VSTERPARTAALAERLAAARERAEALPGGALVSEIVESERDLGGGLIAGGVAFRLFLWLVPFGLVIASILSYWREVDPDGIEDASRKLGLGAAATAAATEALHASDRNVALILASGLVLLAWFTIGAVRALVLAYALAWQLKPPRIRRPFSVILIFNGIFLAVTFASTLLAWLREELGRTAVFSTAGTFALSLALVLFAMWLLPHRATRARELLPGALVVALGSQLLQIVVIFYFAPRLGRSDETYGALGAATTLLVWLYVLSRLFTGAAFLNATLWQHRAEAAGENHPA